MVCNTFTVEGLSNQFLGGHPSGVKNIIFAVHNLLWARGRPKNKMVAPINVILSPGNKC